MGCSRHRKAFEEFAEKAEEELGDSLKKLVLYGSVARGDETEGSDVDILAVVESEEQREFLENMAYEIGIDHGLLFSPNIKTQERFTERIDHPFIQSVLREGEEYA